MTSPVILLGPQRHEPILDEVLRDRGLQGPFALVTAGWQEREQEDEELREALGGAEAVNLRLYQRFDELMEDDRELAVATHERQEALREIQDLYRIRLGGMVGAARDLMARVGHDELLAPERRSAIEMVRQLDRHHTARVEEVHRRYEQAMRLDERQGLMRHRAEVAQAIQDARALFIAGGHVAVLLNRMMLFGLAEQARQRPVVAWAAGAMAVAERVVLFHDSPPEGAGHAEVLGRGLGLCRGVLPLPHAHRRLKLDDPLRVALLSQRFVEMRPVCLDRRSRIDWDPPRWTPSPGTQALGADGAVTLWEAA
ncbi:MAG: hypothetical protein KC731_32750 [Myxococcales bacterium]|nr:hypothetical protein [Myxococcales bacterium]